MRIPFIIWKPNRIFLVFSIIIGVYWFFLGPLPWRHIDDWGVNADNYLLPYDIKYEFTTRLIKGWGTYPPVWNLQAVLSNWVAEKNLTLERYLVIGFGYLSTILIAIGTYSTVLSLTEIAVERRNEKYFKSVISPIIQSLALIIVSLNMEILVHASSLMSYQLPALSTTIVTVILASCLSKYRIHTKSANILISEITYAPLGLLMLALFISLGFQSILLLPPLLIATPYLIKKIKPRKILFKVKKSGIMFASKSIGKKRNLSKKLIKTIVNLLISIPFIMLSWYLVYSWISKFLFLSSYNTSPGSWSLGRGAIYDLSINKIGVLDFIQRVPINTSKIVGLAMYSGRTYQLPVSVGLFLILIACMIYSWRHCKIFISYTLLFFLELMVLAASGKIPFTPTRHLIYAFPLIWITFLLALSLFTIKSRLSSKKSLITLVIILFSVKGLILHDSYKSISYPQSYIEKLNSMALSSNQYYIPPRYFPLDQSVQLWDPSSQYAFTSTHNYQSLVDKSNCQLNQNKNLYLFLYTHRHEFKLKDLNKETINPLLPKACRNTYKKAEIIEQIERTNLKDVEQDNMIYNGGSSLYAYSIKLSR